MEVTRPEPNVSLREYVDARMQEQKRALDLAFDAAKAAIASQRELTDARFEAAEKAADKTAEALREYKVGSNEWRDTVKDLLARGSGREEQRSSTNADVKWMILSAATAVGFILDLVFRH